MATTTKSEKLFIGIDDQVLELTGTDKEAFLAQRKTEQNAKALLETEYKAKQDSRESAIKKLAEIAGLTEEEIEAII
jgi:hypothetical protein